MNEPTSPEGHRPPIRVYSKPSCVQCTATYRALDKYGIEYEVFDVSTDDAARQAVIELGYLQAPVVVTPTESWAGFQPQRIAAIGAAERSKAA